MNTTTTNTRKYRKLTELNADHATPKANYNPEDIKAIMLQHRALLYKLRFSYYINGNPDYDHVLDGINGFMVDLDQKSDQHLLNAINVIISHMEHFIDQYEQPRYAPHVYRTTRNLYRSLAISLDIYMRSAR
jgi:hypothetical protein